MSTALGIATFAAIYGVASSLRSTPSAKVAEGTEEFLSVDEALDHLSGTRIAVRGYVFLDEEAGELLCSRRTTDEPIACAGQSLRLVNLDTSRLDLVIAPPGAKGYDAWTKEPVSFVGIISAGSFAVEDLVGIG